MISISKRKVFFERLDLGEYNSTNIKKLQKKYLRKCDVDGIYGKNTDILLRNLYRTKVYSPHFDLTEFKCECGGKYCTGYPKLLNVQMLLDLEALRVHLGCAITITSGLRDKIFNNHLKGSIPNSYHLYGEAVDICCSKTSTLAKRKEIMKWIYKQRGVRFTYCNGWQISSAGSCKRSASNMGTSIHFEVKHGQTSKKADRDKALKKFLESKKKKEVKVSTAKAENKSLSANEKRVKDMKAFAKKYANDNSYKYRKWSEKNKYTHQCPLCHPESNKHATKGWNCRGLVAAILYHGGKIKTVKCSCSGLGLICKKLKDFTLANWQKHNGKGWKRIVNLGKDGEYKNLKKSQLKDGDVIFYFDKNNAMQHVAFVYDIKNGKIADATSSRGITIRVPKSYGKVAFRYVGV